MSNFEPFFFGRNDELFGQYHVAQGARRASAVLVAQPLLNEDMRAHSSLRTISMKLAADGYDVLRFDYAGVGNSTRSCDTVTPSMWQQDILAAADELREISGNRRLSIVAVRFSASLAAAVTQTSPVDHFVTWDALPSGKIWLDKMLEAQAAACDKYPYLEFEDKHEFLGHRMPETFRSELESIVGPKVNADKLLRVETDDAECGDEPPPGCEVARVPFHCNWESLSSQVLYPHAVIDEICNFLT